MSDLIPFLGLEGNFTKEFGWGSICKAGYVGDGLDNLFFLYFLVAKLTQLCFNIKSWKWKWGLKAVKGKEEIQVQLTDDAP